MKSVYINFVIKRHENWTGITLLVLSLIISILMGVDYVRVNNSLAEAEIAVGRYERRATRHSEVISGVSKEPDAALLLLQANDLVKRLSMPWDRLFRVIEAMRNENIALLSVEPDLANGTVLVVAEARDIDNMIQYVASLGENEVLVDVVLREYQVMQQAQYKPVKFSFVGAWIKKS